MKPTAPGNGALARVALSLWLFTVTAGLTATDAAAAGRAAATQINREGAVTVKVAPLDLSAQSAVWRFEVVFDTHVAELNHDVAAVTVLADGSGREFRPSGWEGDRPGGHHRKGVVKFDAIRPSPASVTLKIREVGGVAERVFTWPVAAR